MPRSRSARHGLIAYRVSHFFRRWVNSAFSRNRAGVREKQRVAAVLDSLENRQMLNGTVSGTVWLDTLDTTYTDPTTMQDVTVVGEDGVFQQPVAGEPSIPFETGVAGVRVFVDANDNLQYDVGETTDLTDINGVYLLENVTPGTARVRIDLPEAGDVPAVLGLENGAFLTYPDDTLSGPGLPPSEFNIEVVFLGGLNQTQQDLFTDAAARWESIIREDLPDVIDGNGILIDDVRITAEGVAIDGAGGILGQAGPRQFRPGTFLPSEGVMQFDSADLNGPAQGLLDTITHEMGHVLGIGTIWNNLGFLQGAGSADPRFDGINATREYENLFIVNEGSVPVANTGGGGTRDAHWRESVLGIELMTGFLNGGQVNPVSRITVGQLEDLGYGVNYDFAEAYTPFSPLQDGDAALSASTILGEVKTLDLEPTIATLAPQDPALTALVAPVGYDLNIAPGEVVMDADFGVAPLDGDNMGAISNRPPITSDQRFEIISYDLTASVSGFAFQLDSDFDEALYPTADPTIVPGENIWNTYIVGEVIAADVDGADQGGDTLFYKIIGGNLGDEEKAFGIVRDQAEADDLNARFGAAFAADGRLQRFAPGTIYVNNEFMLDNQIRNVDGNFELEVLVADENPDSFDDDDDGVDGGFKVINVDVALVDFNRVGEAENNDSPENAQWLNAGDEQTHQRLEFNIPTDDFLEPFLDGNILGDPANNQFGPTDAEWVYIDGEIEQRSGARDVDYYEFTLDARTGLFIDIDAQEELGSALDSTIRIFDDGGNLIGQAVFDNTGQAVSSSGYDFQYFVAPQGNGVSDARSADPSLYIDLNPADFTDVSDDGTVGGSPDGEISFYISVESTGLSTGEYQLRLLGDRSYGSTLEIGGDGTAEFYNTIDIDNDGVNDSGPFDVDGDSEDVNGNGILDGLEDLNLDGDRDLDEDLTFFGARRGNFLLDAGEDLNGNGFLDTEEDVDGDGRLDLGEDIDTDGNFDTGEDVNQNGILDMGEDQDGDGILDLTEDLNGDGIFQPVTEDLDGDGRFDDVNEDINGDGVQTLHEDLNGDGLFDQATEDIDGDGNFDAIITASGTFGEDFNQNLMLDTEEDLNNDQIFNRDEDLNGNFILDFNEDFNLNGVLDTEEDIDGDRKLDTGEDVNANGVIDAGEDVNNDGVLARTEDIDFDGNFDIINEDLDGDIYLDAGEDVNHNGVLDAGEDVDGNGLLAPNEDLDGDGNFDVTNEDIDGDGALDNGEDANGNGVLDFGEDVDMDGILDLNEDLNSNGIFDPGEDLDGDGNFDDVLEDLDGDGNLDLGVEDIDGDGNFDNVAEDLDFDMRLDLGVEDIDGDGNFDDINEDANRNSVLDTNEDLNNDRRVSRTEDFDNDGNFDIGEDANGNGVLDPGEDLDGDFILDTTEDLNGDGRFDLATEDIDGDGRFDNFNEDIDGDLNFDQFHEDIDGDGNFDTGEDTNQNGILDAGEDVDGDGILDLTEDLNGDFIFDPLTEDLDGDGNFDNVNEDLDGDANFDRGEDLNSNFVLDLIDEDLNQNGVLDSFREFDLNFNGVLDYGEDTNMNGVLDFNYDIGIDVNGDGVIDTGTPQEIVYLDFDGATVSNIPFGTDFVSGDLGAYDFSGDPDEFTPGERLAIQNIFRIVREDMAAFNVNVTTQRPIELDDGDPSNDDLVHHIVVTETAPFDFFGDSQATNLRIHVGNSPSFGSPGVGLLFAGNVLNFSPGDTNPQSGRIVAAPIETGNYVSNLVGLMNFLDPFNGVAVPNGGTVFPDAIVGVTDTGLNRELWHFGTNSLRSSQFDDLTLNFTLGYRNGAFDELNGILGDRDGQRADNGLDGAGGTVGGQFVNYTGATPLPVVGSNDSRGNTFRYGTSGLIGGVAYNDPDPEKNEADHDLFTFSTADSSRLYIDLDEYSSNYDARVWIFQVNNQGNVANIQEIGITPDPTTGELISDFDGQPITGAEIVRAENDGITLTGLDAYVDLDEYSRIGPRPSTIYVYVGSETSDQNAFNNPTRWLGTYDVLAITQAGSNLQPDGPDNTLTIVLDENDQAESTTATPIFPYFKMGEVNLGQTAFYTGDPQNPEDGGRTGQIWTFAITSGDPQGIFDIDSATGDLYVVRPELLDFETQPVYNLIVQVTDNGDAPRTAAVTVDVVLRDVNEVPVAPPLDPDLTFSIVENSPGGTVVGQIDIQDPEDSVFVYQINTVQAVTEFDTDGVTPLTIVNVPLSLFTIDGIGQVTFTNNPLTTPDAETYFDFEEYKQFRLNVTATEDRFDDPMNPNDDPNSVTFDTYVNITDINEAPRFAAFATSGGGFDATTSVSESAPNGTFAFNSLYLPGNIDGTTGDPGITGLAVIDDDNDPEGRETFTFSIENATVNGGAFGSAAGVFAIDAATGRLTVANADAIDFEDRVGGQFFDVTIRVTDDGGLGDADINNDAGPFFDEMILRLTVDDESPEAPVLADQTVSIAENSVNTTPLVTLLASDDDSNPSDITYAITAAVSGLTDDDATGIFTIDPMTGVISVADELALSYEAFLPQLTGQIRLTVTATDETSLFDDATITVNVTDVVESAPTGTSPQVFNIQENIPGFVGQVVATDADPTQSVVAYTIVGGDPGGLFSIDNTGVLSSTGLDFETQRTHILTVEFTDNDVPAQTGQVQVTVNVLNVNEPPSLPMLNFNIDENTPDGTRVNGPVIRAFDPEGNIVSYELLDAGNPNGAFSIVEVAGGGFNLLVANSAVLDFEQTPVFNLQVQMTDNADPSASAIGMIQVTLNDIDEFADIVSRVDDTGAWYVYRSDGTDFTRDPSQFGLWSTSIDWTNVMSGDFNGDNRTDVIGRDPAQGFWYVGLTQNDNMVTNRWGSAWVEPSNYVDFVVGDFNGDGRDDVAGREITTGQWRVGLSTGTTFTNAFWTEGFDPSIVWSAVSAGDFDGDGMEDVVGFDSITGQAYLATSTGTGFTVTQWGDAIGNVSNYDNFMVADFDGDGDDDLAFRDLTVTSTGGAWRYVVDDAAGPGTGELTNMAFANISNPGFDNTRPWRNIKAGDFDGNGRFDIVAQDGETKDWYVLLSRNGDSNTRIYARWADGVEHGEVEVADFNGDGLDDIAARRLDTDDVVPGTFQGWDVGLAQLSPKLFVTENWGDGQDPLSANDYVDSLAGQFDVPGRQPLNEDSMAPLDLPVIPNSVFQIPEDAANGTIVGTLPIDSLFGPTVDFSIVSGNTGGALAVVEDTLNNQLVITVVNSQALDFETRPVLNLVIEGDDSLYPAPIPGNVQINVTDVAERPFADVISQNSATGEWFAYRSNGTSFSQGSIRAWSTAVDWTNEMTGDFNGDGLTDIIAQNPNNNSWFVGLMQVDGLANATWGPSWGNFANYTDFLVADFNGDGQDDVAGRNIATGDWRLGISTGSTFTDATWTGFNPAQLWTAAKAGDFDGDGNADIVAINATTGQFIMAASTGADFVVSNWGSPIGNAADFADFLVGDFDGDGDDDLAYRDITVAGNAGQWQLVVDEAEGPMGANVRTNNPGTGVNNVRTYRNFAVGDFDGNGKDDILFQDLNSRKWFVLISRNGDSNPRIYASWSQTLETGPVVVGDFNDDGLDDIAARRLDPRFDGAWQMGIAQTGGVPGASKRFLFSRWDVNDPVAATSYVNNFAAHTDVQGEQPNNEKAVQPTLGFAMLAADSPVTPEIPEDFGALPAATESSSTPTIVDEEESSTSSIPASSADALDDFVSGDDDLIDFLNSMS